MKFLLVAVNAKYIHTNPAIYSLRGYLPEDLQSCVTLREYTINQETDEILEDMASQKPTHIGFSCYLWNIEKIRQMLPELLKILPGTEIWLGGPEITGNYRNPVYRLPGITGLIYGEGEAIFADLVKSCAALCGIRPQSEYVPPESISGIVMNGELRRGAREPVAMDDLPFLYEKPEDFANKILYYESQRGCPYSCSYCMSANEKKLRFKSLAKVEKELQLFLDAKVPQVKFTDRTFNCNEKHALGVWKYLLEHDNGVSNFHFEVAAECMTEAELALLKRMRPGLVQLEMGVQTTNPQTLAVISRTSDFANVSYVAQKIREGRNIHLHLDLIAGLPLEDYESFGRSFNDVYGLRPNQLQLGFLKVLHGTPMEKDAPKYGIIYHDTPPYEVLSTDVLSYEEVRRLKKIENMVEIYYNSGQFTATIQALAGEFPTPFAMYEAMADYYEKNGLFVNTPARVHRYEVLLDFIRSLPKDPKKAKERDAFYRETLVYDMYLRENLRTRPSFATEQAPFKDILKKAKTEVPKSHVEPFFYRVWEETDGSEYPKAGVSPKVKEACPVFLRFDYENRDPLSYNARVSVWTPESGE